MGYLRERASECKYCFIYTQHTAEAETEVQQLNSY